MKAPDLLGTAGPGQLLAVVAVPVIGAVTFFLTRWIGRRLNGATPLGLRGLERLAPPVTLFAIAGSVALLAVPIAFDPGVLSFAAEVAATVAGFWLVSRSLDVFWKTGERSARLRHQPAARAALTSVHHLGKVIVWVAAPVAIAVKFGAADQLYLLLGGLGAALAFSARDPIRNAFAFATMLVDPPFRPGDLVRLEDFRGGIAAKGTVLSMSLSSVTLETRRGTQVVVSNVRVGELRVENLSVADRRRLELVLPTPAKLSTEGLRAACVEIEADLREHPSVSETRAPRVWISSAPAGVQIEASLWLRKASSRREAQRDLMLLIRARLEQHLGQGRDKPATKRLATMSTVRRHPAPA